MKKKVSELSKEEQETALAIFEKSLFINALDASWPKHIDTQYFRKWLKAGLNAANFGSVLLPWLTVHTPELWDRLARMERDISANADIAVKATTAESIKKAHKEGKFACIFGTQCPEMIERDLNLLKVFYELGFRVIGLAYQRRNFVADGCGEKANGGISLFGGDVIKEMNRLGIIVDLSHVGIRSSIDAMNLSDNPCIFSHSNPRVKSNHNRTLIDEQIQTLAEKGGVVGLTMMHSFLKGKGDFSASHVVYDSTIEDFLDHIDYIADLVGIDHVAVGMDYGDLSREDMIYGMWERYPSLTGQLYDASLEPPTEEEVRSLVRRAEGLRIPSDWVNAAKGMVARGYSEQEIHKVLGRNLLRVFESVFGK